MAEIIKAKEPFIFSLRTHLSELTGLRAANLSQLLGLIKTVPDACIYHHTHRFIQQHPNISTELQNEFAYWVKEALGDGELEEKLASIDIAQFSSIAQLRAELVNIIEEHLTNDPFAKLRFASYGAEFHFIKSISFVLATNYRACDLREFIDILARINVDSLYFHIFEARLRWGKNTNDFSNWIETSVGDKELADSISNLDTYSYNIEDLRRAIIKIIGKRLKEKWRK